MHPLCKLGCQMYFQDSRLPNPPYLHEMPSHDMYHPNEMHPPWYFDTYRDAPSSQMPFGGVRMRTSQNLFADEDDDDDVDDDDEDESQHMGAAEKNWSFKGKKTPKKSARASWHHRRHASPGDDAEDGSTFGHIKHAFKSKFGGPHILPGDMDFEHYEHPAYEHRQMPMYSRVAASESLFNSLTGLGGKLKKKASAAMSSSKKESKSGKSHTDKSHLKKDLEEQKFSLDDEVQEAIQKLQLDNNPEFIEKKDQIIDDKYTQPYKKEFNKLTSALKRMHRRLEDVEAKQTSEMKHLEKESKENKKAVDLEIKEKIQKQIEKVQKKMEAEKKSALQKIDEQVSKEKQGLGEDTKEHELEWRTKIKKLREHLNTIAETPQANANAEILKSVDEYKKNVTDEAETNPTESKTGEEDSGDDADDA